MCNRSGIIDQTLTRVSLVISSFSQFSKCLAAVAVLFFKLASLKYVEGSRNVILIVSCTSRFIDIPQLVIAREVQMKNRKQKWPK